MMGVKDQHFVEGLKKNTIYSNFCLTRPVDRASVIVVGVKVISVESEQGVEDESGEDARARSSSKRI